MAETGLVAIGTRGTVGSLLRREMEYHSHPQSSSNRSRNKAMLDRDVATSSSGRDFFPGIIFRFQKYHSWRKKKLLVPGICLVAERDCRNKDKVPGFVYNRILRDEEYKSMHM